MPGIVVAGTHSGCGKTTMTLGLMAAFVKKGIEVQPFKAGPDFIDAGLHRLVTGRRSRNLDLWMCGEDYVRKCYDRYSSDAGMSIVEGVMGLYDGKLSTASLAAFLDIPVVLVVDAYGMAETAGAVVKGMLEYGKRLTFAGVIFNRVGSERHFERLSKAVGDMPVLGYLPRDLDFEIPHRHLGLMTAEDRPISDESISRLADAVIEYIDVDKVMEAGKWETEEETRTGNMSSSISHLPSHIRIAVARDRAFCFYYEDNLDMLKDAGAELVFFSPLEDNALPEDIEGIYIGGGYPELHAAQLSRNEQMRMAIKERAESGMPIYAECGGLMYLSSAIQKSGDEKYDMAGVFRFDTVMKQRLARLGYREVMLNNDCIPGDAGTVMRGHEFHYSDIAGPGSGDVPNCYNLRNADGTELQPEGYTFKNVLGSYIHVHFGSSPGIAEHIINFMKKRGS